MATIPPQLSKNKRMQGKTDAETQISPPPYNKTHSSSFKPPKLNLVKQSQSSTNKHSPKSPQSDSTEPLSTSSKLPMAHPKIHGQIFKSKKGSSSTDSLTEKTERKSPKKTKQDPFKDSEDVVSEVLDLKKDSTNDDALLSSQYESESVPRDDLFHH